MEGHSGNVIGGMKLKDKPVRVMVCDNSVEISVMYTRYFCSMGCKAVYLHSGSENIFSRISDFSPDAVLLSIPSRKGCTEKICSYLQKNMPHTKIIILSYVNYSEMKNAVETDADLCIFMPSAPNEVYRAVIRTINSKHIYRFEQAVSEFLAEINIPVHLKGFSCLCSAVSLTIVQPDTLSSDLNSSIYSRIASAYGISTRTVERALSQMSKVSFKNGITSAICGENYCGSSAMSSYELICSSADAFATAYNLFTNK